MIWLVTVYFQNKVDSVEQFASKAEAMSYFESKAAACRLGLVGWSVSYPKQVQS